jgi:hypothetical protein
MGFVGTWGGLNGLGIALRDGWCDVLVSSYLSRLVGRSGQGTERKGRISSTDGSGNGIQEDGEKAEEKITVEGCTGVRNLDRVVTDI